MDSAAMLMQQVNFVDKLTMQAGPFSGQLVRPEQDAGRKAT